MQEKEKEGSEKEDEGKNGPSFVSSMLVLLVLNLRRCRFCLRVCIIINV